MNAFVVGISGKARNGKDTLAKMIHSLLPNESRIYSLANALKCYCRVAGLMEVKDGKLLQLVGTDLFRRRDPTFWIRMLEYQLAEEEPAVAIIPDIRFKNEVAWAEERGICIRAQRLNDDGTYYVADDRPANHPSEAELDKHEFSYYCNAKTGDLQTVMSYAEMIAAFVGQQRFSPAIEDRSDATLQA